MAPEQEQPITPDVIITEPTARKAGYKSPPAIPFSSTHQPTIEKRKRGRMEQLKFKELLHTILTFQPAKGNDEEIKKVTVEAAEFFGVGEKQITLEILVIYKQIRQAILKGDNDAARLLLDRAYGKPPMQIHIDPNRPVDPEPAQIQLPGGMVISI